VQGAAGGADARPASWRRPDGPGRTRQYTSDRGLHTLAVGPANGAVSLIERYPTEQQPRGLKIDPSGNFLLAVGRLSDSMTSYHRSRDGQAGEAQAVPDAKNPNWIEIIDLL
jgi:6-phosphogluconolactonase